MENTIEIPIKEYVNLLNTSLYHDYLESAGVDNWNPGYSFEEYLKSNEIEEYKITDFKKN